MSVKQNEAVSRRWHEAWGTDAIEAAYAECLATDFVAHFFGQGIVDRATYLRRDREIRPPRGGGGEGRVSESMPPTRLTKELRLFLEPYDSGIVAIAAAARSLLFREAPSATEVWGGPKQDEGLVEPLSGKFLDSAAAPA